MRGLLLPGAALLLPHDTRWEALAAVTLLLLPRVCRRWEALAATAPLLLSRARRRLHRTTRWRCGWWLLLLIYACRWLLLLRHSWWLLLLRHTRRSPMTPPHTPRVTTTNAPTLKRWAHMNCFISIV
jgi:hypothetical protein